MMASKRPEEAAPDTPRRTWRDPNVQLRSAHSSVTAPIGEKRRPTTAARIVGTAVGSGSRPGLGKLDGTRDRLTVSRRDARLEDSGFGSTGE